MCGNWLLFSKCLQSNGHEYVCCVPGQMFASTTVGWLLDRNRRLEMWVDSAAHKLQHLFGNSGRIRSGSRGGWWRTDGRTWWEAPAAGLQRRRADWVDGFHLLTATSTSREFTRYFKCILKRSRSRRSQSPAMDGRKEEVGGRVGRAWIYNCPPPSLHFHIRIPQIHLCDTATQFHYSAKQSHRLTMQWRSSASWPSIIYTESHHTQYNVPYKRERERGSHRMGFGLVSG